MATTTANVLARVEPETKERAEAIMTQLGVPASVVINMLYKQIILTKSIPFTLSIPTPPVARDEMDTATFNQMMQTGYEEARTDKSLCVAEAFAQLKKGLPK